MEVQLNASGLLLGVLQDSHLKSRHNADIVLTSVARIDCRLGREAQVWLCYVGIFSTEWKPHLATTTGPWQNLGQTKGA